MTGGAGPAAAVHALLRRPDVACALALLDRDGEEARIVGGAVRNALLGEPVHEVDVATTALPEDVVRRAEAARIGTVPTGIAHGTVTLLVPGAGPVEVTTLRSDVETDGRHAVVAFGRDWQADAARRDFTINALSMGRDGAVHDYAGGLRDLARRRVRFIGAPRARIREDFLRILRFFRFHAHYGTGAPDAAGLAACIEEREGLVRLSAERIGQELLKLLKAERAPGTIVVMADCGIAQMILGGVPRSVRLQKLAAIEAALELRVDAVLRLSALAAFVEEDAERLQIRLRLSNRDAARLAASAVPIEPDLFEAGESAWKSLLYRAGIEGYRDRILLAGADLDPPLDELHRALALPEHWKVPALPVNGRVLLARGVPPGPAVGRALAEIERRWIEAGFPPAGDLDRILGAVLER